MRTLSVYLAFSMLMFILPIMIFNLNKVFSRGKALWVEKNTPFECGFNPISKFSLPVSMPFFLVGILFLIFDIEITILIPMVTYLNYTTFLYTAFLMILFVLVMLSTLVFEWFMGYLSWMY